MGKLVNQHALAHRLGRSRAAIVAWALEGMPVARRAGQGRPTLYDVDLVLEWMRRNGRGVGRRAEQFTQELPTPAAIAESLSAAEIALGRTLERALVPSIAGLIERGLAAEAALGIFDELVVWTYSALEIELRREVEIPIHGTLELLMSDAGRAQIVELAQALLARGNSEDAAPQ